MTTTTLKPTRYVAPCGMVAESDNLGSPNTLYAFAMTPCCEAAATGTSDPASKTGVVCKACYRDVSAKYGTCGWEAIHQAAKDAGCPCPVECADFALHRVMEG